MRLSRRLLALALATCAAALGPPTLARAQPFSLIERSPTDGIALPPTGAALVHEASAPEVNPAGLGTLSGAQLLYLHERSTPLDGHADALFLGANLFGSGLSAGLDLQWLRWGALPRYRKVSYSLALGGPKLSVGGSFNSFYSPNPALADLSSFDVGLLVRPWRLLSVGASVRDVDSPSFGGTRLPRRFDLGLGFRPGTDRMTLGADLLVDDRSGFSESRLSFTARAEPVAGLTLLAGLGVPLGSGEVVGQLGVTVDTSFLGLGYSLGRGEHDGPGHLFQARLSSRPYRSLAAAQSRYLVLDLKEQLSARSGGLSVLLQQSRRDPYLELLALLRRLHDEDLQGLVVRIDGLDLGQARAEELRDALLAVRASGKHLIAYFVDGGDTEYLIASAAERIYAAPQASLMINGFSMTRRYLGETLDRIGVSVDVARVGAYKSAPDQLTETGMSAAEREMLDAYLDDLSGRYVATLARSRKLSEDQVRGVISCGVIGAEAARQAGFVDALAYPDQLAGQLKADLGRAVKLIEQPPEAPVVPDRWGPRPRIAVLGIQGLIAEGRSRNPLGASPVAGAQTLADQLEQVRRDSSIRALVLRIDSGGGGSLASDFLWRAVARVRETKPVVVSMGDAAASGGYYIAVAADEIWAEPATLTGSIGVFALKPNLGPLLARLGLHEEVLKRGERADLLSLTRPWTEGEQQQMQQLVDGFYEAFIDRVAKGRKLDRDRVDALGRGRIWSGAAAKELGLVDRLGGLSEAIESAKIRAGLVGREVDVALVGEKRELFTLPMASLAQPSPLLLAAQSLAAEWGLSVLELGEGPLAVMPAQIEIK